MNANQVFRIAMGDYSHRSQQCEMWGHFQFSCEERGQVGSFLSWVAVWGVKLKSLKGLWGVGFEMPAQCCKTASPPSQVINDQLLNVCWWGCVHWWGVSSYNGACLLIRILSKSKSLSKGGGAWSIPFIFFTNVPIPEDKTWHFQNF